MFEAEHLAALGIDAGHHSARLAFPLRFVSVKLVEIGVEFEVAIGQAASGGSFAGSESIIGGVSSAIASICM